MAGPVELIIFDCDGVLVDSERLAVSVEAELLADLGWPITEQEVLERFVGRSDRSMLGEIEKELGRPVPELLDRVRGRIYSVTEVAKGKPAPDLFLHAAARSGVPADRCIVIDDSRSGVEAARAAGMRSFGYAGGLTSRSWLEGPDTIVFDDMAALPRLVASLVG